MNPESHPSHSSSNRSDDSGLDDLQWLAFCYVADELDHDQRSAFESRLEIDQTARDAVASAVRHSQTIHAAIVELKHRASVDAEQFSDRVSDHVSDHVSEPSTGYAITSRSQAHSKDDDSHESRTLSWRRITALMTAAAALLVMTSIWAFEFSGKTPTTSEEDLAAVWISDALNSENLDESLMSFGLEPDDEIISVAFQRLDLNDEEDNWMLTALDELESEEAVYFEFQNEEGGLQ